MFDAIDRLVHTGDPDAAVHQLRRLLVLHPALQPAYARLAELTGEADVFEHAAALAPGSAHAALVAGHALQRSDRPEAAALRLEAAARLVPSGELLSELGIALKQAGRRPEALAAYSRAVRVAPAHAQAYNNLGVALQEEGDVRVRVRVSVSPNPNPNPNLNPDPNCRRRATLSARGARTRRRCGRRRG